MKYSRSLGILSAILTGIFIILFDVFIGLRKEYIYQTSALFIFISLIIMIISLRQFVPKEKHVFIDCAICFILLSALFNTIVYYKEISFRVFNMNTDEVLIISSVYNYYDAILFGYGFLCLSMFFLGFVIERKNNLLRLILFFQGALSVPCLFLFLFSDREFMTIRFIFFSWSLILFPLSLLMIKYFRNQVTP
jgi:hypothetical protein